MDYYFLRDDIEKLAGQIHKINARIKAIGKEMGASCEEGAETFHDNFAFEDGERQQQMWSKRLKELLDIYNHSQIYKSSGFAERVGIGREVTLADLDTGEEKTIKIGSYMSFNGNGTVSYNAPLARILLGAEPGEVRKGEIAGRLKKFEIVEIN
ncbi:MAG: GreA/GreB family elongation factor [Deltaproteobacteria bacterium]|nr:GreA/GreB family elongation factor [Deltaproteobacteria bacterium]